MWRQNLTFIFIAFHLSFQLWFQSIVVFEILILAPWRSFLSDKHSRQMCLFMHLVSLHASPATETQSGTGRAQLCPVSGSLQTEADPHQLSSRTVFKWATCPRMHIWKSILLVCWRYPIAKVTQLRKLQGLSSLHRKRSMLVLTELPTMLV